MSKHVIIIFMYIPIQITTLKAERKLPFDLFIYFKEKFVLYSHSGEAIDEQTYNKLRDQRIAEFYIDNKDEAAYQKFLEVLLYEFVNDPKIKVTDKVHLIEGHSYYNLAKFQASPQSEYCYKNVCDSLKNLRILLDKSPKFFNELLNRAIINDEILKHHSLNVSSYVNKLSIENKCSEDEQVTLSLAGFLHDLGHNRLPAENQGLYLKRESELVGKEKEVYKIHSTLGSDLLAKNSFIPQQVIELVQYHELNKTNNKSMSLSEEIFSVANSFDKKITFFKMNFKDALEELIREGKKKIFNMEIINSMKKVLQNESVVFGQIKIIDKKNMFTRSIK